MSRLSTYMALPTLRGSNANGEFVRFADGTQICTRLITVNVTINTPSGGVFASAEVDFGVYPAAFVEPARFSTQVDGIAQAWIGGGNSGSGPTAAGIRHVMRGASTGLVTAYIFYTAIGRWY